MSVCPPRGPGPLCGLLSVAALADLARDCTPHVSVLGFACSDLQADRGRTLALSWGSWSLHFFFFCKAQLKTSKALWPKGCQRTPHPSLESFNTYRFIPAFNYCLSLRDLILRNADDGGP